MPGSLAGTLWLYTDDGIRWPYAQGGPRSDWNIRYVPVGTHTYYAKFEGTDTQPPSVSNIVTQVVKKARVQIEFFGASLSLAS